MASIVSGVVLHAPFMRKLAFGTVCRAKAARARWLDLPNLLGTVATAWLLVVSATGIINTLTLPLLAQWQRTELADMTKAWRGQPPPSVLSSAQRAIETAQAATPGMDVAFVGFPGGRFMTPHHYMIFMRGDEALTSRLLKPVIIDAEIGKLVDSRSLPLKIIWTLLDLGAIGVLGRGLYLWLARGRTPDESRLAELESLAS